MKTKTVDIGEARLPDLLAMALAEHEVIIAEGGTPLARLLPVGRMRAGRVAGLNEGLIRMSDDFDEPLPKGFWAGSA